MTDTTHLDTQTHPRHIPVLLQETYRYLVADNANLKAKETFKYLDCNFGDAGHTQYFAESLKEAGINVELHAIDADADAIARGLHFLKENPKTSQAKVQVHKGNFRNLQQLISEDTTFDSILFDLGLSTYQLGPSSRGFSFKYEEALDMRFSTDALQSEQGEFTAYDIVNYWSPDTIALILRSYADESRAWKIAKAIEAERENGPIETSSKLVDLLHKTLGNHKGGIHPATKTFQALRIAVNNEIQTLEAALEQVLPKLKSKGRVGIISYHSLEDTIVKKQFKKWEEEGLGKRIEKKVVVPTEAEAKIKPRSRSAKFRIFEKK